MVVDAAPRAYNTMSSTSPEKKSPQMNGYGVLPPGSTQPRSSRSLRSAPVAQRMLSGCPGYMAPCGWMRRSESSCTLNSGSSSRGRMRPAGSLPSICKPASDHKTVKKTSCLLVALRPTNVDQERDKFFLSNYSYNPQFLYEEPMCLSVVEKYSQASSQFLEQALRILNAVLRKYGSYEAFESLTGGNLLSKCQIWACCRRYMQKENCSGEVVVQLTEDLLSQAVITNENSRPTLTINLLGARQHWLEGMLRHEIGTHYLRGVNDALQSWHGAENRKQFGLKPVNPTEEGLASLHSVLYRKHPYLWRAALLYYTVSRAATCSFAALFTELHQFVEDPAVRWEYCVRAKRGQKDTAQPGCFSKDQVYLDGIIRILRYRHAIDFRLLTSLGKVAFEDVERLHPFAQLENTRLPHFMRDMEKYYHHLNHVMEMNQLSDEELCSIIPDFSYSASSDIC
ncbi:microtubule-associated tyrosine carboxypeptidase 1 isoform 1-T3 [Anomaloglossus baeobatrachus]|uniref:microtubule-associated tyrosine carboxypeptidase 1 n=1 Tax=Anomaloglossus baeobatrachus TaxID=238106 RepID=UPI003F4FFEB9